LFEVLYIPLFALPPAANTSRAACPLPPIHLRRQNVPRRQFRLRLSTPLARDQPRGELRLSTPSARHETNVGENSSATGSQETNLHPTLPIWLRVTSTCSLLRAALFSSGRIQHSA
jgi:hypothetical protein